MLKYLLIILLFSSCVTTNKVKRYLIEHPVKAAEICLEQFPQENKTDTIRVVKDSIRIDKSVDTLYKWVTDTKFIDKPVFQEKIKTLLKQYHDTVIINNIKWDDKYKVLYEAKDKDFIILEDKYSRAKKSLFWTWLWIAVIGVGTVAYKRYL
jgi:hypothetical protein